MLQRKDSMCPLISIHAVADSNVTKEVYMIRKTENM